ncbi:MAG TPA: DUF6644 family protein [Bryobacteraceae bacterium]|nr:DUF6644 family protein [Bryobacteraceae bacterium]
MSADQISTAIQNLLYFTAVRESGLLYPVILSSHLAMIAVFGGLILLTDLRLLNVAMKSIPASVVVAKTRPWKNVGLMVMLLLGIHLGGAKFHDYYDNPYFLAKMALLVCVFVHAMLFRKSVYTNPKRLDSPGGPPASAKLAATLSLVIWVSILSCGRMIAYWDNPSNQPGKAPILHPGQTYGRSK